jgi:hypothetical protein
LAFKGGKLAEVTLRLIHSWNKAVLLALIAAAPLSAQTVVVDATPTHVLNEFVPNQTLGAGIDRIPVEAIDKDLLPANLEKVLEAGWQPVSYRQNTELAIEAWHWNPSGTWSDPSGKGYFTGSTELGKPIRYSFGYSLPHRGTTRNDGTDNVGFSRLTDGDINTYWKSNPYLTRRFTGESDETHPQWVLIDLAQPQMIQSIRIAWAEPFATRYLIQEWTGDDPLRAPTKGVWRTFPGGTVIGAKGGTQTVQLAPQATAVRFLRILMTESSNTCDSHGSGDPRNCVGYAIKEIYLGTVTRDGIFHDVIRHTPDQEQTATYSSSVDPWHEPSNLSGNEHAQMGFDLFYSSGVTRQLPAMMPVAVLYDTPDNAAAEITYLEKRKYPVSYVEMGEEMDGQFMLPEDYAALYIQWATVLHGVDPSLKLGGPSFEGVNSDIETWPDSQGEVSWTRRFIDYLKRHNRLSDLSFFSFEHYPYDPCKTPWGVLYDEPSLVTKIMQTWRDDGVPANVPLFITESNLSSSASETYMDIFSAPWLGDYIGSFLAAGGKGVYFFHYLPLQMEHGCNDSPGTFGMFTVDEGYHIQQNLPQFFAAQLINREWVIPGGGTHRVFAAKSDVEDGAEHALVTAYALERPDGQWSVLLVNRDQESAHTVKIWFDGNRPMRSSFTGTVSVATFGKNQYHWNPATTSFMAHAAHAGDRMIITNTKGHADPDGPILHTTQIGSQESGYELPPASVVVIRGQLAK